MHEHVKFIARHLPSEELSASYESTPPPTAATSAGVRDDVLAAPARLAGWQACGF
jgi:hypothetical protein